MDRVMFGYGTPFGGELALVSCDPAGDRAVGVALRDDVSGDEGAVGFLVLGPAG